MLTFHGIGMKIIWELNNILLTTIFFKQKVIFLLLKKYKAHLLNLKRQLLLLHLSSASCAVIDETVDVALRVSITFEVGVRAS